MQKTTMHKVKGETMGFPDSPSMLPSFHLTEKDFPEIKNWQVGKKYTVEMEVEQVSMSKDEYGSGGISARFKIHKIGKKEIMNDKEKEGRMGHY